ncbi:TRAP transporter large permease [Marinovum sp. 2_MG-2023]|uniref:TRAP transporter large permease n=1 Tax=unclassified Marinovum TaxID=2647166 RepID=UPI0026E330FD|nr:MULTISPECIES: TRAP transporter large permease [unclassified Marinovum]MDO6731882.1 TRAP transporter large permease [Marinovum sp. 2_MG-2023]MDO6781134.1 TRAP transporter large permease [Marinovum sp. 1_MG-2023]
MIIALSVVLVCVLLFAGISVPLAFGGVLIFLAYTGGHDVSGFLPTGHWKLNTVVILVIPLFILAGDIMKNGRIAAPIVDLAEMLLGRIRGGLSGASVVASAMFGAISGSGAATLTCIGAVMMPHLRRANYPEGFSAALLVAASPLGLLIPPSSAQLIYAWLTQQSVLKCFLATVVPGIIVASLLVVINLIMMRKQTGIILPVHQEQFVKAFSKKTLVAFPALMMPIIILGGIYGGIMTPTEAAGVAVIYAIPIGFFVYKGLNWKIFMETLKESSVTIGVVMVMIFMVLIVSRFLIFEDIPGLAEELIFSISKNPIVVLLMINLTMILIGMIMDDFSGLILSATLLLPIAKSVGVDPIHFAAILGVNLGMGNITPPTAPLLFLGARVTGAPVQKMLGPTMIFIIFAWLPTLALTTFVPGVALWLPDLLLG